MNWERKLPLVMQKMDERMFTEIDQLGQHMLFALGRYYVENNLKRLESAVAEAAAPFQILDLIKRQTGRKDLLGSRWRRADYTESTLIPFGQRLLHLLDEELQPHVDQAIVELGLTEADEARFIIKLKMRKHLFRTVTTMAFGHTVGW